MTQLQKYTWLIEVIRRSGRITFGELSDRWERNKDLSDNQPLNRATFNRWREAIYSQFGIDIACQRTGGYLYYIDNPESIDDDQLKKWMLDTFAAGNLISENFDLKDRILVGEVPSGRDHLTNLLEAMKANRVVNITYKSYKDKEAHRFPIQPYCVKLFENRWYALALAKDLNEMRTYALDRIEDLDVTDETFVLPKNFSAHRYFENYYGIVVGEPVKPMRVVLRVKSWHAPYMKSLPLHHSQQLLEENEKHADFELFVAPTYDFVMKLLQAREFLRVLEPASLRQEMKARITAMAAEYKD